jgi:hypothetical protein
MVAFRGRGGEVRETVFLSGLPDDSGKVEFPRPDRAVDETSSTDCRELGGYSRMPECNAPEIPRRAAYWKYAAATKSEGNAADGPLSTA